MKNNFFEAQKNNPKQSEAIKLEGRGVGVVKALVAPLIKYFFTAPF